MLSSFIVKFVPYLSCEKNENKQKEAVFGPFLKGFIKGAAEVEHPSIIFADDWI